MGTTIGEGTVDEHQFVEVDGWDGTKRVFGLCGPSEIAAAEEARA